MAEPEALEAVPAVFRRVGEAKSAAHDESGLRERPMFVAAAPVVAAPVVAAPVAPTAPSIRPVAQAVEPATSLPPPAAPSVPPSMSSPSAPPSSLAGKSIPPAPSFALLAAIEGLEAAREELLSSAGDEIVAIAIEVARTLLDAELESRPELHRQLVRTALEVLGPGAAPRVRVSQEAFDSMIAGLGGRSFEEAATRLELEIDPTLSGAGVVLEAGAASVDGRLDTRLSAVRTALTRARREARSGKVEAA
jgi:hypothetical protein